MHKIHKYETFFACIFLNGYPCVNIGNDNISVSIGSYIDFERQYLPSQQAKLPRINVDSRLRSRVETTLMDGCEVKLETT